MTWPKLFKIHQAKAGLLANKWFFFFKLLLFDGFSLFLLQKGIQFLGWTQVGEIRDPCPTLEEGTHGTWVPGLTSHSWCWKALGCFWTLWTCGNAPQQQDVPVDWGFSASTEVLQAPSGRGKALKKTLGGVGKAFSTPQCFVVMLAVVASSSEVSECLQ